MTDPAQSALRPAEIQQQLIQCADLLRKFETPYPRARVIKESFLRDWYQNLISARTHYLQQQDITEAQWNILAQDGQPE
ncbi:MAG TPA: hypothetical protein VHZ97_25230 [Pseudonocardiaceae bacterium]|nr:hypothetical protein [Pseudonocardiaceae bacterium]